MTADHSNALRVIIFIHDISRNAAEGVATLMTLAGSDPSETLILAPQFPLAVDVMRFAKNLPDSGASVARWPVDQGWPHGGESRLSAQQKGISSFTAVDYLLMFLSDRNLFPSLQQIVVAGHGTGGDYVQRYAAVGRATDIVAKDNLSLRFVVANASSYLYMTGVRPVDGGARFDRVDARGCAGVNEYPYGLDKINDYARQTGANAIRLNYPQRQITYLVGDKILLDNYLDRSCEALVQGQDRTERGRNFARYLTKSFGAEADVGQSLTIVPNAGYDPVALFGSYCGMSALFGDGKCQ